MPLRGVKCVCEDAQDIFSYHKRRGGTALKGTWRARNYKGPPMFVKRLVGSLVTYLGYEIHKPKNAFDCQQMLLSDIQVRTIFDIGAHIGEITAEYRRRFPSAMIYSFEPLPEAFEELRRRFEADNLVKPVPLAVSSKAGRGKFFVNQVSTASSLLPALDEVKNLFTTPDVTKNVATIEVPITTIDEFCRQGSIDEIEILKIDIQGGELEALEGATEKLEQGAILLIYSEISFLPIYAGQALYYEICSFLFDYGYALFDWYNPWHSANGQVIQGDALFISPRIRACF